MKYDQHIYIYKIDWITGSRWRKKSAWWRHQMETFSALLALCEGNPPVTGGFPSQRSVTRSFDDFFHLRLNKWSSKQSRRRWFETPLRPSWRHWNPIGLIIPLSDRSILRLISTGMQVRDSEKTIISSIKTSKIKINRASGVNYQRLLSLNFLRICNN